MAAIVRTMTAIGSAITAIGSAITAIVSALHAIIRAMRALAPAAPAMRAIVNAMPAMCNAMYTHFGSAYPLAISGVELLRLFLCYACSYFARSRNHSSVVFGKLDENGAFPTQCSPAYSA